MKLPQVIQDARIYFDGDNVVVGQGSVALPSLQAMSETVKGAGIAGEIEMPLVGQYQSMTTKLDFTTISSDAMKLSSPSAHDIVVRGSQQLFNTSSGVSESEAVTAFMKVVCKQSELGKLEKGSGSDTSIELEVLSIRLVINNEEIVNVDKCNYVCEFGGVDYMAQLKRNLGM